VTIVSMVMNCSMESAWRPAPKAATTAFANMERFAAQIVNKVMIIIIVTAQRKRPVKLGVTRASQSTAHVAVRTVQRVGQRRVVTVYPHPNAQKAAQIVSDTAMTRFAAQNVSETGYLPDADVLQNPTVLMNAAAASVKAGKHVAMSASTVMNSLVAAVWLHPQHQKDVMMLQVKSIA